jgi:hypothetical protein
MDIASAKFGIMKNIFVLILLLIFGILYLGFLCLKHWGVIKNDSHKLIPAPVKTIDTVKKGN